VAISGVYDHVGRAESVNLHYPSVEMDCCPTIRVYLGSRLKLKFRCARESVLISFIST
jgi:hypothetical protein